MTSKNPPNALMRSDFISNQISSRGMAPILGQKYAKIRTLHFLAILALLSYLKFRGFFKNANTLGVYCKEKLKVRISQKIQK